MNKPSKEDLMMDTIIASMAYDAVISGKSPTSKEQVERIKSIGKEAFVKQFLNTKVVYDENGDVLGVQVNPIDEFKVNE